jgi:predicted amidophosphoribosyltransferase
VIRIGGILEENSELVRVELVYDPITVTECWFAARHSGELLVCYGCDDDNAWIVALLILVGLKGQDCVALCGACLRELPKGTTYSRDD